MIQRRDLPRVSRSRSRGLWGLAAASLLAGLIGCGGGGDDDNNGTGTNGTATGTATATTSGDVATVNIPNAPGTLAFSFLTGAGREAGDRSLTVRRLAATDANSTVETRLQGDRRLVLNRYSSQILDLNVPTLSLASREFTNIQLDALQFDTEDINDQGNAVNASYSPITNLPVDLPASVRVFPGRTVHVPFYFDNDVIQVDSGVASFSLTSFQAINFRAGQSQTIQGTLADYVAFDLSALSASARPSLANGNVATRVYFSGDGYALSDGDPYAGSAVNFEPILPEGQADVAIGRLSGPSSALPPPPNDTAGGTPGTYSMVQPDPTANSTLTRITSLQGTWRDHFRQILNTSGTVANAGYLSSAPAFTMLTIPSSSDNGRQDLIAVAQTITTNADGTRRASISNCYFGYVDYEANRFFMYPVRNITSVVASGGNGGQLAGEVSGTVSSTLGSNGVGSVDPTAIRSGSFSITSGGTPDGFPASGRFVVFRR